MRPSSLSVCIPTHDGRCAALREALDSIAAQADPHPVHVSYRWFDADGQVVLDGMRTALRRPLPPGEETDVVLRMLTPWDSGRYQLRIAAVQELVGWFDEFDPRNGLVMPLDFSER